MCHKVRWSLASLFCFMSLAWVACSWSQDAVKTPAPTDTPKAAKKVAVSWLTDYAKALEKAKEEKKPVLMDVSTDWCVWCKKMDQNTFQNSKFLEAAKGFVLARIDGDANKDLLKKYEVRGFPTVVFLDAEGNLLHKNAGYAEAPEFVKTMQEVLKKISEKK